MYTLLLAYSVGLLLLTKKAVVNCILALLLKNRSDDNKLNLFLCSKKLC